MVYQNSDGTSLELQIGSMGLLNQEHIRNTYPNGFFHNILIALSAEQTSVQQFGMEMHGRCRARRYSRAESSCLRSSMIEKARF